MDKHKGWGEGLNVGDWGQVGEGRVMGEKWGQLKLNNNIKIKK